MQTNIVRMNDMARGSTEHTALINSLEVLDWTLQTQTLIKATGLPLGEMLGERSSRVPNGSLANRLGHSTLESFVTSPQDEYGVNKSWDQWNEHVTAFRYKSLYDIYVEEPKEIILQFTDVCKILGHIPANSAEYHQAKDSHLINQKSSLREKHELELAEMNERMRDLIKTSDRASSKLKEEELMSLDLKIKYDELISETDRKLVIAREEMRHEKVAALEAQKKELEDALIGKIESIRNSADLQVSEANERLNDIKSRYNSDSFVARKEHEIVQQQLSHERDSVRDILVRLNDAEVKCRTTESEISENRLTITSLEKTIDEQAILINALQSQLAGSVKGNIAFSNNELNIMSARVEMLEGYLAKFRESSNKWKSRSSKSVDKIEKLRISLETTRSDLNKIKKIKKSKNYKVAAITFGTISLSLFAALAIALL
jgi:hypothetical protein